MRKRRFILAAIVLALLVGVLVVVWEINDWPPPRLILKYGFPPTGGPTGNVRTIEGSEFVELSPGYFRMGSHHVCERGVFLGRVSAVFGLSWGTQPIHDGGECPTRWVEVSKPFWIARTEVKNAQFERYWGKYERPPESSDDRTPVTPVTWENAFAFCDWITERVEGVHCRLPTEAEWEYACRAGTQSAFCFGEVDLWRYDSPSYPLRRFGWFAGNTDHKCPAVGTLEPNGWGLLDMHGSVYEWCWDRWHDRYEGAPSDARPWLEGQPLSTGEPLYRVVKGGSYMSEPESCRSCARGKFSQQASASNLGFRPVFTHPEAE